MRVPNIALFTLAVLAAQGFSDRASATASSPAPTQEPESKNIAPSETQVNSELIVSIAPPETQVEQRFASQPSVDETTGSTLDADANSTAPDTQILAPDDSMMATAPTTAVTTEIAIAPPISDPTPNELTSTTPAPMAEPTIARAPVTEALPPDDSMVPSTQILPPQGTPDGNQRAMIAPLADTYQVQPSVSATGAPQLSITAQTSPTPVVQPSISQTQPTTPSVSSPSQTEIQQIQERLNTLEEQNPRREVYQGSPGFTIAIPSGYGADDNTGFISATYMPRVRYSDDAEDGAIGIGIGLGDARRAVGVELSYTLASLTGDNTEFGRGGFNVKVHRQFSEDFAIAAGWNGFLNIEGDNDFENSIYAVGTKIFRLRDDLSQPFSRLALTAGLGNGQFRSEEDVAEDNGTVNVFGSAAIRIARPVSLITEWTGQDLAVGVSIAPLQTRNFSWVITPALRDIAGAGDGARFVLNTGFSFKF